MQCKICGSATKEIFTASVLFKYPVKYFQCAHCNFIQTENPFWLDEAYQDAVSVYDVYGISRPLRNSSIVAALINRCFDKKKTFLDYGGGSGVFTRVMRDKGFPFLRYDLYSKNLYARGFDQTDFPDIKNFELVTCFEVFEHLPDPMDEIKKMLELSGSIFFSTSLIPHEVTQLINWTYIAPECGQHIAFYDTKTMQYIAEKFQCRFITNGLNYHLLTKKNIEISQTQFIKIVSLAPATLVEKVIKFAARKLLINENGESLTETDAAWVQKKFIDYFVKKQ